MAKSFLKDYTIGKDIIDNVEEENFPAVSEPKEKDADRDSTNGSYQCLHNGLRFHTKCTFRQFEQNTDRSQGRRRICV